MNSILLRIFTLGAFLKSQTKKSNLKIYIQLEIIDF